MAKPEKEYCDQHHKLVEQQGFTRRAILDIDSKITKLFSMVEKLGSKDSKQDKEIATLNGFVKSYGFQIMILGALIAIIIKLWRG